MAGNNDEVYDEKPQRYAEDAVLKLKPISNNNKRPRMSYCFAELNY